MEVIQENPPNYHEIKLFFPLDLPKYEPLFPFGDKLYNPSGKEIPADVMFHEQIHSQQQGKTPERWWKEYLINKDFRKSQEVEAYAYQYLFVKNSLGAKIGKEALYDFSDNLSSPLYQLNITRPQAETLIRLKAKHAEENREKVARQIA